MFFILAIMTDFNYITNDTININYVDFIIVNTLNNNLIII